MSGMGIEPGQAASLLQWWRDAGVDVAVRGNAPAWLDVANAPTIAKAPKPPVEERRPAPAPTPAPAPVAKAPALPSEGDELDVWLAARCDERGARHVAAVGPVGAPLMIMGDRPDREDVADASPFGGDNGTLANAMVKAMGHDADAIRQALLEPGHLPGERISDHETLGKLARQQVREASPKALVLFGDATARAVLGEPLAKARGHLHTVEGVPTVATFHPRWLLQRPQDKKLAWNDLLLLMGTK